MSDAQDSSKNRLKQLKKQKIMEREKIIQEQHGTNSVYSASVMSLNKTKKMTLEETERLIVLENERHARLIGQLKAAEAKNR